MGANEKAALEQRNNSQILDEGNESVNSSFGIVMSDIGALYLHFINLIAILIMETREVVVHEDTRAAYIENVVQGFHSIFA